LNPSALRAGDRICASRDLQDGGPGIRFSVVYRGRLEPAFAVRYRGQAAAFLNRCAHKLVELDWEEGRFFDTEGKLLVCATHGARYDPLSGACVTGPCHGGRLITLGVEERNDGVWLAESSAVVVK
jgi:nitrite reductase/ring-hydroxylating ferredoxin subunit